MVVHGIHAILWALDKLVELGVVTEEIVSLKVQFRNFIPVGKQVELKLLSRDDKSLRAGALPREAYDGHSSCRIRDA